MHVSPLTGHVHVGAHVGACQSIDRARARRSTCVSASSCVDLSSVTSTQSSCSRPPHRLHTYMTGRETSLSDSDSFWRQRAVSISSSG